MGNANISQLWSAAREAVWLPQQRATRKEHRSSTALFVGGLGAGKLEQYKRLLAGAVGGGAERTKMFSCIVCSLHNHWILLVFFLVYPY